MFEPSRFLPNLLKRNCEVEALPVSHLLLLGIVSFLSIGGYLFCVCTYSFNLPNADDYDVFLSYLLSLESSGGVFENTARLFTPHNEHVLVWSRLVAILLLRVTSEVDFRALILIGNVGAMVVLISLFASLNLAKAERLLVFSPVPLLLFAARYAEASLWASAALQVFWGTAFAFLAFLLAWRPGKSSFAWSVIFAALSAISQANGLFCFLALACTAFCRREGKKGFYFFALFVLLLGLYLYWQKINHNLVRAELVLSLRHIDYFFSFLGSGFAFEQHSVAFVSGVLGVLWFFVLLGLGFQHRNPFLACSLGFLIFTAGAGALSRVHFGIDSAYTQSRYAFFSLLFFSALYLSFADFFRNQTARFFLSAFMLCTALVFHYASYIRYLDEYQLRKETLVDGVIRWELFSSGLPYPGIGRAEQLLEAAQKGGWYHPPATEELRLYSSKVTFRQEAEQAKHAQRVEYFLQNREYASLSGWVLPHEAQPGAGCRVYLRLEHAEHILTFNTQPRVRPDVSRHLAKRGSSPCGYFSLLPLVHFPASGDYQVSLVVVSGSRMTYRKTRRTIRVERNFVT